MNRQSELELLIPVLRKKVGEYADKVSIQTNVGNQTNLSDLALAAADLNSLVAEYQPYMVPEPQQQHPAVPIDVPAPLVTAPSPEQPDAPSQSIGA